MYNIILPKVFDIIEVIDTTSIKNHNKTKNLVKSIKPKWEDSQENLVKLKKKIKHYRSSNI